MLVIPIINYIFYRAPMVAHSSLREILNMRKILLASTALVAMSVTAAQADINISGSVSFEVADDGAATTFVDDSNLMVTGGRTMDNGVTATVAINITGGAAAAVARIRVRAGALELLCRHEDSGARGARAQQRVDRLEGRRRSAR